MKNTVLDFCKKTARTITANRGSIRIKIIIGSILLVIAPMILVSTLSSYFYIQSVRQERVNSLDAITVQISEQVSSHIKNMNHITKVPLYNSSVMMGLRNNHYNPTGRYDYNTERELEFFLESVLYIDNDVSSIIIYTENNGNVAKFRGFGLTLSGAFNPASMESHDKIAQANGSSVLLGEQTIFTGGRWPDLYAVSSGRALRDSHSSFETIAYIIVSIDLNVLADIFIYSDIIEGQMSFLVSESGDIICSSTIMEDYGALGTYMLESAKMDQNREIIISDSRYLISSSPVADIDWYVFSLIPESDTQLFSGIQLMTLTMIILFSTIAAIISVIFTLRVTAPIKKVVSAMESFGDGNYEIEISTSDKNEIYHISRHFNRMIRKINNLDQMFYLAQFKQKEAELIALKLQINPHFLFNSLESIHMVAELNNDRESSVMARQLGRFYRYYILESNEETVSIGEEIKHLTCYISLIKVRFGDKFDYLFDVPESLMKFEMLKFILQPIIENALFHGFKSIQGGGLLRISAHQSNGDIVFEVCDNGLGIERDSLIRLRSAIDGSDAVPISGEKSADIGIGLLNVNQRLKLYYGHAYALEIDSEISVGTTVLVKIPTDASINRVFTV